ncbi:MAG: type VI secretion system membrane subunit TssM [Nannocystaceae bacterium]
MIKYIVSVLLVAVAWGLTWFLEWPMWISAVATAVVIAALVVVVLVLWRRRRRAERKAAADAAAAVSADASPDFHSNVEALRSGFQKTISVLEQSKLGRRTKRPADALPWYVMLGAPDSGKSTSLRASGVRFPYQSSGDGSGGGRGAGHAPGGTRGCDFWMSNEAVVLDTSGRYVAEHLAAPEWIELVDLIKKHRPRRPLNGVVVTIAVDALRGGSDEQLFTTARQVRARVDELVERLQMKLPVYVFVTKCDLMVGFAELFGDLDDHAAGQVWGFTNPRRSQGVSASAFFGEYYEELVELARRKAVARLEYERDPAVAARVYGFSQQLCVLRARLAAFVGELFSENIYRDMPLFRGVYLCSGAQDGVPADGVLAPSAQALGIPVAPDPGAHGMRPRGFFLRDVFEGVVFRDRFLATRTAGHAKRRRVVRYAAASLLTAAALAVGILPALSFLDNREMLGSIRGSVEAVAPHFDPSLSGPVPLALVRSLHDSQLQLSEYEHEGPPWSLRYGMYRGAEVLPELRKMYGRLVQRVLLADIVATDEKALREFVVRFAGKQAAPKDDDYYRQHSVLRRYLLVTSPAEAQEPGLDQEQRTWLSRQILRHWGEQPQATSEDSAAQIVEAYLELLGSYPDLGFVRDAQLVVSVRSILRRTDRTVAFLVQLIDEVEKQRAGLTLRDMTTARSITNGNRSVRAAFTRKAWEGDIKPRLDKPLAALLREEWVVGQSTAAASTRADDDMAKLRSRYFERYLEEWLHFVRDMQVTAPKDYVDGLTVLQDLTRGATPPLGTLMRHIAYNTRLTQAGKKAGAVAGALAKVNAKAGDAVDTAAAATGAASPLVHEGMITERDVELRFEPLVAFGAPPPAQPSEDGAPPPPPQTVALDIYQEQLVFLRDALQSRLENPEDRETLPARLKQARTQISGLIAEQDVGWRPFLDAVLWPPIHGLVQLSRTSVVGDLAKAWCNDVVTPFERNLASKYPFRRSGYDATMADFVDFYRPETGKLWAFYNAALGSSVVTREGDAFAFREQGASNKTNYERSILPFLQRSQDLGRALFPPGASGPAVSWDALIHGTRGVSVIELAVDGVTIDYRNGPERWQRLAWPGEGDKRGASLRARGRGINGILEQEGEWGLFRLLDQGQVSGSAAKRVFSVRWDLSSQNAGIVTMKFRPTRGATPFFGVAERPVKFLGLFRHKSVRVPRKIVADRAACKVGGSDG